MLRRFAAVAVVALMLGWAGTASADTFTFANSNCNSTSSQLCGFGPWGTVTLTQNGATTVDFNIQMASGFELFGFGWNFLGGTAVALNVSSIAPAPPWVNKTNLSNPGNRDGFGSFDYFLSDPGGGTATPTLTFSVTRYGGGNLSVADLSSELSHGGSGDAYFVAEVSATPCAGTLPCTGWAGAVPTPVPEPASALLLGTGLVGLGMAVRRRRS